MEKSIDEIISNLSAEKVPATTDGYLPLFGNARQFYSLITLISDVHAIDVTSIKILSGEPISIGSISARGVDQAQKFNMLCVLAQAVQTCLNTLEVSRAGLQNELDRVTRVQAYLKNRYADFLSDEKPIGRVLDLQNKPKE